MIELLGLAIMASWVWSVVIIVRKTKETLPYEKAILIGGLITAVLCFIGLME